MRMWSLSCLTVSGVESAMVDKTQRPYVRMATRGSSAPNAHPATLGYAGDRSACHLGIMLLRQACRWTPTLIADKDVNGCQIHAWVSEQVSGFCVKCDDGLHITQAFAVPLVLILWFILNKISELSVGADIMLSFFAETSLLLNIEVDFPQKLESAFYILTILAFQIDLVTPGCLTDWRTVSSFYLQVGKRDSRRRRSCGPLELNLVAAIGTRPCHCGTAGTFEDPSSVALGVNMLRSTKWLAYKNDKLGDPDFISRWGFMYDDYKKEYVLWDVKLAVEKAALVASVVVCASVANAGWCSLFIDPFWQVFLSTTVSLLGTMWTAYAKPYRGDLDRFNHLATMLGIFQTYLFAISDVYDDPRVGSSVSSSFETASLVWTKHYVYLVLAWDLQHAARHVLGHVE
eukprot:scaffold2097_cov403-Prasinococcus_capsulatus_cf.AAC.13